MSTSQSILAGSLVLSWSVMLTGRTISAMIYANAPSGTYEMGLTHMGMILPASAWACLVGAVIVIASGYSAARNRRAP